MSTAVWTKHDEQVWAEMQERRQRVLAERRQPLLALAKNCVQIHQDDQEEIVDWMIQNADSLRDALWPYDSGVRSKQTS